MAGKTIFADEVITIKDVSTNGKQKLRFSQNKKQEGYLAIPKDILGIFNQYPGYAVCLLQDDRGIDVVSDDKSLDVWKEKIKTVRGELALLYLDGKPTARELKESFDYKNQWHPRNKEIIIRDNEYFTLKRVWDVDKFRFDSRREDNYKFAFSQTEEQRTASGFSKVISAFYQQNSMQAAIDLKGFDDKTSTRKQKEYLRDVVKHNKRLIESHMLRQHCDKMNTAKGPFCELPEKGGSLYPLGRLRTATFSMGIVENQDGTREVVFYQTPEQEQRQKLTKKELKLLNAKPSETLDAVSSFRDGSGHFDPAWKEMYKKPVNTLFPNKKDGVKVEWPTPELRERPVRK